VPKLNIGQGEVHFEVHGEGRPVVLLHGGTVSFKYNYADLGWIKVLNDAGMQVIGLDFRGHGQSDKPHDPAQYGTAKLASDVIALLDHLALERAALVAYSIGTAVAIHLLNTARERFDSAALVATGDGLIGYPPHTFDRILPSLALVLERTEYPQDLPKHLAAYWNFITSTAGDKRALLAFSQARYPSLTPQEAEQVSNAVLVVSGEDDLVLGTGPRLARALCRGEYLQIPGADHFSLAADRSVMAAVAHFLKQQPLERRSDA
jgi:pimeloyl-ACP methyl ester carboxylesterase